MVKGWIKWWLLSVTAVGILLAWGSNFSALNYFLFDHFPLYNKFRAPSTALFMPQLAVPILVALGEDNRSVRAFERTVNGRALEFFKKSEGSSWELIDSETGSAWDFNGKARTGALVGQQLKKVAILEDYWFDWTIYHPDTAVYQLGPQ